MDVLVVDDHPIVLEVLSAIVRRALAEANVSTAATLPEALRRARDAVAPELMLLDLGLPGCNGIEALARVRSELPQCRVLVVSALEDPLWMGAALDAGAAGYIPKSLGPQDIAAAVRLVAQGGIFLPPGAPAREASQSGMRRSPAAPSRNPVGLTEREMAVLRLLARGLRNKQIARELQLAEGSVKQHVHHMFRALGAGSRAEALASAARRGVRLD